MLEKKDMWYLKDIVDPIMAGFNIEHSERDGEVYRKNSERSMRNDNVICLL